MAETNLEELKDRYFLKGIIDRFQGKTAVIKTEDGQQIVWPIKDLPEECEAGTEVRIILASGKSDQIEREKVAKTILNEILKN